MKKLVDTYAVQIVKEKKGYSAVVLGLDNDVCASQGDTKEEVVKNISEAIELYEKAKKDRLKNKRIKPSAKKSYLHFVPVYA